MEVLEQADRALFFFLNGLNHPALDPVMVFISGKFTLIPFYFLLLWLVWKSFSWKGAGLFLVAAALIILLADQGAVHLFKNVFQRYRPCHNLDYGHLVHTAGHCGGQFGFVSNHAANSAAIATFVLLMLRNHYRKLWIVLLIWVGLVGYSRIYLGVHYPADILGGWLFGGLIGMLVYLSWKKLRLP